MRTYRSNSAWANLERTGGKLGGSSCKGLPPFFWINTMTLIPDELGNQLQYLAPLSTGCNTVPPQKGNNPMYEKYDCGSSPCKANIAASSAQVVGSNLTITGPEMVAEDQRKYVAGRALMTIENKILQLRDKFKIDFEWRPKTVQEANERLRAGLFTIRNADKKDPIKYPWGGLQEVFSWRGPDDQADEKGYDDAVEKFAAFYQPLLDEIRIFDPKDALETLRKIEAYEV